jgi:type IV pilus assembly protein PilC
MSKSIDIRNIRRGKATAPAPAAGKGKVEKASPWRFLEKDIKLFGSGIPDKIKESFYIELSTLAAAGMDIRSALELIKNDQPKKKYREVFDAILVQIVAGSTLSAALKKEGRFTPYEYYSVQIGEETGKMVHVLNDLAAFYKQKIGQRRQIIGALTYPVLVLVVAFGAVSFMMAYVVPMFADVLKRLGGDLPLITKWVLGVSFFAKRYSPYFLGIALAVAVFLFAEKDKPWLRAATSRVVLKIPVIGGIVRKVYIARFANAMSLMISARIPILQAIRLVKEMVGFYPIEQSLGKIEEDVLSGIPLHTSLGEHPVYPGKMVSFVKVGEEVNQLDRFFGKIAGQYSAEIEYQTNLLSKFMEPLIIVVLGLVVGVILVAMYLPLFKLGQTF